MDVVYIREESRSSSSVDHRCQRRNLRWTTQSCEWKGQLSNNSFYQAMDELETLREAAAEYAVSK